MTSAHPSVRRLGAITGAVALAAAAWILATEEGGPLAIVSLILPTLTGLLIVATIMTAIRHLDELQRRIHLEALAMAFGALSLVAFVLIGLDEMGQPFAVRPGLFLLLIDGLWLGSYLVARRRYQ
jgi:hypothetical protein